MRLIIQDGKAEVGAWTAAYIKKRILDFAPTAERPFVMGCPTGSSPLETYAQLIAYYKKGELSFKHVITFNMDEYVGLPESHAKSYHSFMWENFFKHVDILAKNCHILNGNAPDLDLECRQYEKAIQEVGGIELFLAGCGPDGHIAFNEPGSSLTSRTRVKTLAFDTIRANARFFDNDMEKVPKRCLTVGVGTVMEAREVVVIITGANKSYALYKCIEEGVNHMYTVSSIQMHKRAMIVCDEAATLELRVKTVKYFKSLLEVHNKMLHEDQPSGYEGGKSQPKRSAGASAAANAKRTKTA